MLAIYAVLVGAAPGDVAALTSIDIIAAALLPDTSRTQSSSLVGCI